MIKTSTKLILGAAVAAMTLTAVPAAAGTYNKADKMSCSDKSARASTIVSVAAGTEDLSTLVTAVKAAGLVDTLNSNGPFTVFAPPNSAFAKLPAGTVETLVKPENKDTLTGILTYHVVSAEVMAGDLIGAIKANNNRYAIKTVNGQTLTAMLKDGSVYLKDANGGAAKVIATDIDASNGVVHLIDTVVMPK